MEKKGIEVRAAIGKMDCQKFHQTISYWQRHCPFMFQSLPYDGEEYLNIIADFLQENNFPCDDIVINPFYHGYVEDNDYRLTLRMKKINIVIVDVKITRYGISKPNIQCCEIENGAIREYFSTIIKKFFHEMNNEIIDEVLSQCSLTDGRDGKYSITVVYNYDYKATDKERTLVGTLDEIFDKFTDMNESYKYCNGTYYTFKDSKIKTLYNVFTDMCGDDYFLLNAVKHGRLID